MIFTTSQTRYTNLILSSSIFLFSSPNELVVDFHQFCLRNASSIYVCPLHPHCHCLSPDLHNVFLPPFSVKFSF